MVCLLEVINVAIVRQTTLDTDRRTYRQFTKGQSQMEMEIELNLCSCNCNWVAI